MKSRCSACGADEVVPIKYGEPTPKTTANAYGGEVALGGCIVWPDAPTHVCLACDETFGRLEDVHSD